MPFVTITGAAGTGVVQTVQVTTASTVAIAQIAANQISANIALGYNQQNLNSGTVPLSASYIVGSIGGSSTDNYGSVTLGDNSSPSAPGTSTLVRDLTINNLDLTTATNTSATASEVVLSGVGNLNFTDKGAATTIVAGGGTNTITFNGSNGSFTGDGANTINVNAIGNSFVTGTAGSSDTIFGGSTSGSTINYTSAAGSTAFINPRSSNVTVFGANGAGSTSVFGGKGANAFTGSLSVTGGSGYFQGGSAGNNFLGSSSVGGTTLIGGGTGDLLQSKGSNDVLLGGAGASTLDGSYSAGGVTLSGAGNGASLIYASQTKGDTILTKNSTVQGIGYTGEFIDLHTGPNSLLRSLNANVSSTIIGGANSSGAQFASVGDFISGTDKLLLVSSVTGAASLATGTLAGAGGAPLAYSQVTTANGSNFIFYNATLTNNDIVKI